MNLNALKSYAPQARRDFIAAVTDRAAFYGLTKEHALPVTEEGDIAVIDGRPFPRDVAAKRRRLERRIEEDGFGQVMEAVAYTWFNRLVAIRYMELHGYLDHGYRVLSHPEGESAPEILEHAEDVELPGLNRAKVIDLKLDGTQDEALYCLLLIGQCNALNSAMPFLFERVDDETELLLPDNLIHSDSLLRRLVGAIPEEDWSDVEILGWLYQFYISEKKSQVIGNVVKSEDIPAATQLFTPNWIVKYMVQNSLGAQWVATYPDSSLKGQMDYYIEPAEQTEEVQEKLRAITPDTLSPEEMTLIDPASGSGHILVEAYELFKAIYLERGYRQRDVPRLILEKNLFGLDIDVRAAQLTGLSLMMKARADDRRLFERGVSLNVMALVDSTSVDAEYLGQRLDLADYDLQRSDLSTLVSLFEHATTFGSLIHIPDGLAPKLAAMQRLSQASFQDVLGFEMLKRLSLLVRQAAMLAARYDDVVTNPPYMGSGGMIPRLKKFAKDVFPDAKDDLFACFIQRTSSLAKPNGCNALITMQSWMFLSSYQRMREEVLRTHTIRNMAHLGSRAFSTISGEVVQTTAFVITLGEPTGFKPVFYRLTDGGEAAKRDALLQGHGRFDETEQGSFKEIPGSPVAYWASERLRCVFREGRSLQSISEAKRGVETGDNERFLRRWHEVDLLRLGIGRTASSAEWTWYPYNKGGGFQKWYGNRSLVINWRSQGQDIKTQAYAKGSRRPWRAANEEYYFRDGLTWGGLTSESVTFRLCDYGAVFDSNKGSMMFPSDSSRLFTLAFLNSPVVTLCLSVLNPTISTQKDDIGNLPVTCPDGEARSEITRDADRCVELARGDEASSETSWDFRVLPLLAASEGSGHMAASYTALLQEARGRIELMRQLEEENNRRFITAYELMEELSPEVPIEQITLTVNPAHRYGGNLSEDAQKDRFRQDTMEELVSYAIGCMMGRYSLDEPGLIYAHSENQGFDASRYTTFPADDDGIVPLTAYEWFDDDAAHRLVEFLSVAWNASHLEDNLTFLADNLSPRKSEASRETIRRYLCTSFFKDHLKTYKNRPIYWLFSSGKQRAFQCLVYLHRYNEGTLARMRTEYVMPLQGMIAGRIEQLEGDLASAASTAHQRKLEKERATLVKQRTELQEYDEKLRHFADMSIPLDLDDGVRVNYGKFGDLLAEVKAVTGKKAV